MKDISRRDFCKLAGTVAAGAALAGTVGMNRTLAQAPVIGSANVTDKLSSTGSQHLVLRR